MEAKQLTNYELLRDAAKAYATVLDAICPPGREFSITLTKLEESIMWATAAITRDEEAKA